MHPPHRRGRLRALGRMSVVVAAIAAVATVGLVAPAQAAVPAQGLKGEYFTLGPGAGFPLGDLRSTVLDGAVDYGNLVPVYQKRTGQKEQVGARWTGSITAPTTGDYTFSLIGDNGFRLWIDGALAIDFWENQWDQEKTSAPITLRAGEAHAFKLETFQATGGANLALRWSGPGLAKSIVPITAFTPPADFDLFATPASIPAGGDAVQVALGAPVTGTTDLAAHLTLTVDQVDVPLTSAVASPLGDGVTLTPTAPIYKGTGVRLAYDGAGTLAAGGTAIPAFDVPVQNDSAYEMSTPWAAEVDADNPLPEYPRPQLARERWLSLNGPWQFAAATATSATPFGTDLPERVVVPYPIESALSGLQRHEDHMVYRRTFEVPADWGVGAGQRLKLNFGAVDYDATVFVNGTRVAQHTGGYESFSADVTDALTAGSNELVVRVTDTTGSQPRGKQSANPSGIFYTPSSGIWQTVWLEPVAAAHIAKLTLTPNLATSSLAATASVSGASASARVTVTAFDTAGVEVGRATGNPGEKLLVPMPGAHLWSPDDPYLYTLTASVTDGGVTDTVASYAGMRSIGVDTVGGVQRILLNGQRTFLLSTLDQGYWPDGVYTAPTDAALKWDIQQTKDLGFNTIRKHIKVEPARWYYYADVLGMMVWQDMPSGDNGDEATRSDFRTELAGMVDQLDSVTSIIGWVPFNEGWGEWNRTVTGQVADAVKAQDPSRLVNAHSGVNCCNSKGDSGRGDVIDWHQYTGPALPHPDATRAAIDGEHGGFSYSDPAHTWPGGSVNPYGEVASPAELTAAYVKNTAALIAPAQQDLSGSIYTQITDVEGEVNGFWTYDRRVLKMDAAQVRAINQKVIEVGSQPRTLPTPTGGTEGVAYWPLDENAGTSSADASGNGNALTLNGSPWQDGVSGSGLGFDGSGTTATATVPQVDTTANYTVSAWVRLDGLPAAGRYSTVVSMDGLTGRSAFFLQYGDPVHGFAFSFANGPRAVAPIVPELGVWHHLTGVRDAASGELRMYLDGVLVATETSAGGEATTGRLALGRGQWDGNPVDFLNGAVDNVHVFDRALTSAEVAALAVPPASTIEVVPAAVTFSDAPDTYTVPAVTGVEYLVDGVVVAAGVYPGAGSVTVSARAIAGYSIPAGAASSWSHTFLGTGGIVEPETPETGGAGTGGPGSTDTSAVTSDGLAETGMNVGVAAMVAALLLALGGVAVVRRRRMLAASGR